MDAPGRQVSKRIVAVMLQRLGAHCWHDSPAQAMALLEELEETARLMLLMRGSPVSGLTENDINELRQVFAARW